MQSDEIAAIRDLQYWRKFYIQAANRHSSATKAMLRVVMGWTADADEKEREAVNAVADRIVTAAFALKPARDKRSDGEFASDLQRFKEVDRAIVERIIGHLLAARECVLPAIAQREVVEKEMEKIAKMAPVYPWTETVRGFGARGLAVIVGECGDLANYDDKRKVWKRLGLAPTGGKAMSTWRREGGLTKEDWTEAGYSPARLGQVFGVVTAPLMRSQRDGDPYRTVYLTRRERTAETHPDWTKAHSHNDALRVMTKSLIADLWSAWRRPTVRVAQMPILDVAAAEPMQVVP